MTDRPSEELGADGHIRQALKDVSAGPVRDAQGRWAPGGVGGHLVTGEHSAKLWAALEPAKRAVVERVHADLGITRETATHAMASVVDAYSEAHLLRASMFIRLVEQGGPVTAKGKARALYAAYTKALDQEMKLAQLIGLGRTARPVGAMSPSELMRQRQAASLERS